jgi:hypothetical protein
MAGSVWNDQPDGWIGWAGTEAFGEYAGYPQTYENNFGKMVYIHGMVPYENGSPMRLTAEDMQGKIVRWIEERHNEAINATSPNARGFAIGNALHTIADLYCQSHVQRVGVTGQIKRFQDYGAQNKVLHALADVETGHEQSYQFAIGACNTLLSFLANKTSWNGAVSKWVNDDVLGLAPGAQAGGSDPKGDCAKLGSSV